MRFLVDVQHSLALPRWREAQERVAEHEFDLGTAAP